MIVRRAVEWTARSPGRSFLFIFLLALAIRAYALTLVPPGQVEPHTRWEVNAIAHSLVQDGRFADPYLVPTGPTAHLPPVVPGIVALFWGLFGLDRVGGYAVLLFWFATFSATYAAVPWIAGRLGLPREAGVLAGAAGAFLVVLPGHGESLTALALGLLMVAFAARWSSPSRSIGTSFLLGLAIGASFHVQPALLTVALGWLAFELFRFRGAGERWLTAVMVAGALLACAPWAWRNYRTLDAFFFVRSNLGLELRMGNHEGAAAAMHVMDERGEHRHPRTHREEAERVRVLGEAEYMRQARGEALEWIRSHPGAFVRLTVLRVIHVWCGPLDLPWMAFAVSALTLLAGWGAWRAVPGLTAPQRAALLIPLAAYPLIYYVVAYMPRYRVPLDWILLLLAGAAVWGSIRAATIRGG